MNTSKWILITIGIIVVYLLFVMFSDVSILIENFQKMDLKYILLGIAVIFVSISLKGIRWFLMLKNLNIKINLKSCMLIYFSGIAFGLTPGRLGEVMKSHYLKRFIGTPITTSAPTILVERFFDMFAILIISLFALFAISIKNDFIFIGFAILIFSFFLIYEKKIFLKLLTKTKSLPIIGKISEKLIPTMDVVFILTKPKSMLTTLPLSIVSWLLESLVLYFVLKAFDISLSVITSSFIFVASTFLGSISFLPGGIGATEGGLLGLLYLENISYNDALGPVIMIRIMVLWMTIIFGLIINRITEMTILKNK